MLQKLNRPNTLNFISMFGRWLSLLRGLTARRQLIPLFSMLLCFSIGTPAWSIPTITIDSPPTDKSQVTAAQVTVQGTVTATGGGQGLDLMLVLDDSGSLSSTDPDFKRFEAVRELLTNLGANPNVRIGLMFFTDNASLSVPLSSPGAAKEPINNELDVREAHGPGGGTAIDAGINAAAQELSQNARPDASHVILLFTDGESDLNRALNAAEQANAQDATVSVVGLGQDHAGSNQAIADAGGGSFLETTDPTQLNELFSSTRIVGIDSVSITNQTTQQPAPISFSTGAFTASVDLIPGENIIEITATDTEGLSASTAITVIRTQQLTLYQQGGRLGVDYLTLDELPAQNVTVCVPPRPVLDHQFTGLIPDTLWIAVDASQQKTVQMAFIVSEINATDENRFLFLAYSPHTSPSPAILTTKYGPPLGLKLSELEILGVYQVPAMVEERQTPNRVGLANSSPTSKVTVRVNFDLSKIDEMIRRGKQTIYVQAALIRKSELEAGLLENMILSEMDALSFVANECPAGIVESYGADNSGALIKMP